MQVDTATKFLQSRTVLDDIYYYKKDQRWTDREIHDFFIPKETQDPNVKRLVVITLYNSRIYQIDGMTFETTPKNHVFQWVHRHENGQKEQYKTNLIDYYRIKYGINIRD
jgi:hypothetical protein